MLAGGFWLINHMIDLKLRKNNGMHRFGAPKAKKKNQDNFCFPFFHLLYAYLNSTCDCIFDDISDYYVNNEYVDLFDYTKPK